MPAEIWRTCDTGSLQVGMSGLHGGALHDVEAGMSFMRRRACVRAEKRKRGEDEAEVEDEDEEDEEEEEEEEDEEDE